MNSRYPSLFFPSVLSCLPLFVLFRDTSSALLKKQRITRETFSVDFARPGRVAGEGAKQKKQHTEEVLALAAAPATAGVEFYAQILVITPDQPIVKGQQVFRLSGSPRRTAMFLCDVFFLPRLERMRRRDACSNRTSEQSPPCSRKNR